MSRQSWLWGALAGHRRGRILCDAVGAKAVTELPEDPGLLMMAGDDFQSREEADQERLLAWSREAAHVLLLLPPYSATTLIRPVEWSAKRRSAKASAGSGLAGLLADEVKFELRGRLTEAPVSGASWADLSICTGYYRNHVTAGAFVATCLPIWSLTVLDRVELVRDWLTDISALGGDSIAKKEVTAVSFELTPDHFALMIHLLGGKFSTDEAAIASLSSSQIFALDPEHARQRLTELVAHGIAVGSRLTEAGMEALRESPYAPYAEEVVRMSA